MKSRRGINRRWRQLKYDLRNIAKSHGLTLLVLYLFVKAISKVPLVFSAFKKILHQKMLVRTKILGSWMYLNLLDPGISYQLVVHGKRESAHVEQVRSAVRPGMKGIDIGANIGYYALLESRLVGPTGHVYCIEPSFANFALLRKNIAANGYGDRTSCYRCLVGDKNETGRLFLSDAANSHSVSAISGRFEELPMLTIDHFIASAHINPEEIDFLRMDVEGYEVRVLQYIHTLLANRKNPLKLFIELHPYAYAEWDSTVEKFINYLVSIGFVPKSVVERVMDERGHMKDRAVSLGDGLEVADVLRGWAKNDSEAGFLDNWFFEFTP